MQLNSSNSPHEHPAEKIVKWGIPIGLVGLGLMFFNSIAGFLTGTFNSMTTLFTSMIGAAGAFAAMVVVFLAIGLPILYVVQHPDLISMWWRNASRKITTAFIKLDPLAFMDSFVENMISKLTNLRKVKVLLEGKKIKLERKINDLVNAVDENMKRAQAAKKQGKEQAAIMLSRKAAGDADSVKLLKPMYERMEKYLKFFEKLDESISLSIEGTKYEVDRKREEFEIMKEMHKGLSAAEIFTNTDNEQVMIFQTSVKLLEESVTQKIAYIEDFEKKSKSMMDGMDIEKQMMDDDGLRMLEEYERNGNSIFSSNTIESKATVMQIIPLKNSSFGNLLK